ADATALTCYRITHSDLALLRLQFGPLILGHRLFQPFTNGSIQLPNIIWYSPERQLQPFERGAARCRPLSKPLGHGTGDVLRDQKLLSRANLLALAFNILPSQQFH